MSNWMILADVVTASGDEVLLRQRGRDYEILFNGHDLMSSVNHYSEDLLALKAMRRMDYRPKRILIGGLGLGFTARAVLDVAAEDAEVHVCEIIPEIANWNRTHFGHLAEHPLEDPRCVLHVEDVYHHLKRQVGSYDLILMDTDNGPEVIVRDANTNLYQDVGIHSTMAALSPDGMAYFWSASASAPFEEKLNKSPFTWWKEEICLVQGRVDAMHYLYALEGASAQALTKVA